MIRKSAMLGALLPLFCDPRMWEAQPIAPREEPKKKRCLLCGVEHDHNNAFCCPDHCKKWKEKQRCFQ